MRMRRYLVALLALCLLPVSAALAEGLEPEEAFCPPVEAEIDEAGDFDLSGLYDGEVFAPEDRAIEPSEDDSDGSLDIVIPADVTSIKNGKYRGSDIKSVRFEAGSQLNEIGANAFRECRHLESIELPDTVESVGAGAFMFSVVRNVDLPSATYIGYDAFYWSDLETITLSDNLPEILYRTFEGSHLLRIDIPGSVKRIGNEAFKECKKLETLALSEGLEEIGDSAFLSCESLKGLALPDSVVKIGDKAFSGCAAMETLTLSRSLTEIPGNAFAGCGMKELVVPDNITKIGNNAFAGCGNLTAAVLPDGATFGTHLFSLCPSLQSVTLPKGVTEIPDSMFYGCGFKALPLPDSVTKIGQDAFAACAQLESIEIPDHITGIGNGAFRECPTLKYAKLPKSVTAVSNLMFSKCAALESVEIPEGVTRIGMQAFEYCTSLKHIALPESVSAIGSLAFRGCTDLETIAIPGQNVSFNFYGSSDVTPFSACSDKLVIICSAGSTADRFAQEHGITRRYFEPEQVTLSVADTIEFKAGDSQKRLIASLIPKYASSTLTWTSSDPNVATVASGYVKPVAPGKAVITVTTDNGLTASVKVVVKGSDQEPASLNSAKITVKDQTCTGKALKPPITVTLDGAALVEGKDYTVKYSNNAAVGTAAVTITGTGNYTGTAKCTFRINPKGAKGLRLQAGKKQLTASWKKVSGVSGYQIQYSLKKSFKGAKTVTVNKDTAVKKTIKGLKRGKKYYVRIRSYKTVKGVKYLSAWSSAKRIAVK